ncbi:MAG: FtsQ-type POTRA domain-containing protein [Treponema sp.]|jgi:cell division protein FtsQ|nr:FtsQ-type POTRA domain-containing protein [Treponema sp.]
MSGDFSYADEIPIRRISSTEKIIRRMLLIAGGLLLSELVWLLGIRPCLPLYRVEITDIPGLDRETILAWAGIGKKSSFFSISRERMELSLKALPQIESVLVQKIFPDRLRIILTERPAVAMSLVRIDGRMVPVYFDKEGILIRIGNDGGGRARDSAPSGVRNPGQEETVPLISGLILNEPVLGMRLPASFCSFLANLEKIRAATPVLLQAISEIQIDRKAYEGFDLVLYPVHHTIRVRTGSDINEEMLRYIMLMLDVLNTKKMNVEEIDFRAGMASYIIKEASSGK